MEYVNSAISELSDALRFHGIATVLFMSTIKYCIAESFSKCIVFIYLDVLIHLFTLAMYSFVPKVVWIEFTYINKQ